MRSMKRSPNRSIDFSMRRMSMRSEPRPRIMKCSLAHYLTSPSVGRAKCCSEAKAFRVGDDAAHGAAPTRLASPADLPTNGEVKQEGALCSRLIHQTAHLADRGFEADEDRLADEEVSDVEFADFGNRGNGFHGVVA